MRTAKIFDPAAKVRSLKEFSLNFEREALLDKVPMPGSWAESTINTCILANLVLETAEVDDLVERAIAWLTLGIHNKELSHDPDAGGFEFHQSLLQKTLGLARWLSEGQHYPEYYAKAFDERLAYMRLASRTDAAGVGMEIAMPLAYQAGEYERGVYEYEKIHGTNAAPKSLKAIKSPRYYAYALNLHHARGFYSQEELNACGERVLKGGLQQNWLAAFAGEAAQWLKIVYWHSGRTSTVRETLLKAYDHMPLVTTPEFVHKA